MIDTSARPIKTNLYETFERLENEDTSYYYGRMTSKPITNIHNAWNFIEEYFILGKKGRILQDDNLPELKNNGKHLHTVSLYFLGILFRELFDKKIYDHLKIALENQIQYRYKFTYTWFIACLFHDYSWAHENNKSFLSEFADAKDCFRKNLTNKFHIKYDIFKHKLNNRDNFTSHYKRKIIKNYFHYRCDYMGKADHGIIAGMLLFDRLTKNYYKNWEYIKDSNPNNEQTFENFCCGGLAWRREHLDHFAYIADSIISHNIWFGKDKKIYKKYNLSEIMQGTVKKISISNNPLLFTLGLLDTIEPIKVFNEFNPEYVWKNITMESETNKIIITVSDEAVFNYVEYFKKIKSLEEWLEVYIDIEKKKLVIVFNELFQD